MKILLFIPAYNCENQISRVIGSITPDFQKKIQEILVIENKSTDSTLLCAARSLKENIKHTKYTLFSNEKNHGFGGSKKISFDYAINNNFDYLIELHGDDQANIQDIQDILNNLPRSKSGFHMGARFIQGSRLDGYSTVKHLGNRFLNFLYSAAVRNNIYDLGSGLNIYRVSELKKMHYKKYPNDLTFNYVFLLMAYLLKRKIIFFPIEWRNKDQVSNVRLISQAIIVLGYLFSYLFKVNKFLIKNYVDPNYKYNFKIIEKI